jgi:hypothetical protein
LLRASLAFSTAALLTGCAAVSDISGAVAGLAAGAATANPAVGIGVGIGVRAATAEMLRHVGRVRQSSEQDAISAAIGDAAPGETRPWSLDRNVGADTHGEVRVLRVIDTPIATCREIAFSVPAR